jgi:hypothetical protein
VSSNRILARLSPADFRVLEPNLEGVDLSVRKQLHTRNRRIEHVYFPESGIASIVANGVSVSQPTRGLAARRSSERW